MPRDQIFHEYQPRKSDGECSMPLATTNAQLTPSDAPLCIYCGNLTTRMGACFGCGNCGSTTGCG